MESEPTQDMFQAFIKAREVYETIGGEGFNGADEIEGMLRKLQTLEKFRSADKNPERDSEQNPDKNEGQNGEKTYGYYDDPLHTPALRSIKAAIPYLEPEYQQIMGILVKLIELKKLLDAYAGKLFFTQNKHPGDWRKNMLLAVRPHMEKDKREKIDFLLKAIDMKEMMDIMSAIND